MPTAADKLNPLTKRIFVVDDHPMIREGLAAHLANESSLELCGEAEDVAEALSLIPESHPDLVIVDISLKSGNGIDLAERLNSNDATLPILIWSMHPERLYAERAHRAGARGFVNKGQSVRQLMDAIKTVLSGGTYFSADVSENTPDRPQRPTSDDDIA